MRSTECILITNVHCVSKNDTDVAHYNFDADQPIFSERERDHVRLCCLPSVRLSSVCLSVTFVRLKAKFHYAS